MSPSVRVAHRLGNCNNGVIDGAGYVNLNNEASNAGWDCGVGDTSIKTLYISQCYRISFTPLTVEIPFIRHYWLGEWKLTDTDHYVKRSHLHSGGIEEYVQISV